MKYKEIENPTLEQIKEYLEVIKWSVKHYGCEHYYLYNHKKKCTGLRLLFPKTDSRLEMEGKDYTIPTFIFYMKETIMEILDNNCVSFKGKDNTSIFILCSNYDLKNEELNKK